MSGTDKGRHFSGTNTRMVLDHVATCLGDDGVTELLERAGQTDRRAELLDDASWSSYDQFRGVLEVAAGLLDGPDSLRAIGETTSPTGGTMPEASVLLAAYGSPDALFASLSDGHIGMNTISIGGTEQLDSADWLLRSALIEGYQPFPEYCAYQLGIMAVSVRLFGMKATELSEVTCQRRGDEFCTVRIRWDASEDLGNQLDYTRTLLELTRNSLESFQHTVEDLVSTGEVTTVLTNIVNSASRATRAPAFVLALDALAWTDRQVYAEGLEPAEAAAVAERVLTAGDTTDLGLVVDVASTRHHYGKLVALDPSGSVMAHDLVTLQAFARLAATALDSACAVEEAQRQAATAHALLSLSTALAEITSADELAAKVARAMPAVIDCDRTVVLLVQGGVARVSAHHGFDDGGAAALSRIALPVRDGLDRTVMVRTLDASPELHLGLMKALGLVAIATAPATADGETVGFLVAGVTHDPARLTKAQNLQESFSGLAGQAAVALRNGRLLDQIRHQALHDDLTGLPNRALILDRAEQMLVRARRNRTATAALFIDLDGFKDVNDTLGHTRGDELLCAVAARLMSAVRESDTVGRLGGDEFVVLSDGVSLDAGPEVVAERLLEVLRDPFVLEGRDVPISVSASIGIALGDRANAGDVLRDADIALYSAKAAGKNCFRIFAPQMQLEVRDRAMLADGLGAALGGDQYFLLYQPIFDLQAEEVTGVEALIRWRHPERGVVGPDLFIPLLEESGMIVEVGRWVLHEACRQTALWHAAGHPIDISVNASIRQLERADLVDDVRRALADSGLPPSSLIIEITETAIMRDAEATVAVLTALKALGVRIAIDDFGTGYSSLAYLRQFPVDSLKIDRSFINAIADSPAAGELIQSLVHLGKALGLETLAEGIEHRDQFDHLQDVGCDSGQGFMFARPLDPHALGAFLLEHRVGHAPTAV